MSLEQYKEFRKKFPIISKLVNGIVIPFAGVCALFGLIITCFIFSQMFDDKQTYNSGNTVVDFINWISDAAVYSAESNGITSYETEADHSSAVESNQTGIVDRVGNYQTSIHK